MCWVDDVYIKNGKIIYLLVFSQLFDRETMDFDLILEEIGEFGKFQLLNYLLICLPVFYGAANSLSYVFTSRSPSYRSDILIWIHRVIWLTVQYWAFTTSQMLRTGMWLGHISIWRRVGERCPARINSIRKLHTWDMFYVFIY